MPYFVSKEKIPYTGSFYGDRKNYFERSDHSAS